MTIRVIDVSALASVMPDLEAEQMGIEPEVGTWIAEIDEDGEILGVARITEVEGTRTIDDVWVRPTARNSGIASSLLDHAGTPVWLLCDADMIAFYERRGFALVDPAEFPRALVHFYSARNEWPATDHVHHAMVKR
ncbi:MAG TPA: GNAT family N-acetyltransferase [Actinomycetota bacterium]|nr:GNAT family N-acetyltransferase [Actinomycetota bacterium]